MHELVVRLHHALLMRNSRFGQELGEFLFVVDVKVRSNLIGGGSQEGKKLGGRFLPQANQSEC